MQTQPDKPRPEPTAATNTTDKLLASLRRGAEMPSEALRKLGVAEPTPAAAVPATTQTPAEPVVEVADAAKPQAAAAKPARRPATQPASVQRKVDFDVSTGRGVKHLTFRVPKDLAADLALTALRNKLAENGEPTTINDLGLKALRDLLDRLAA